MSAIEKRISFDGTRNNALHVSRALSKQPSIANLSFGENVGGSNADLNAHTLLAAGYISDYWMRILLMIGIGITVLYFGGHFLVYLFR